MDSRPPFDYHVDRGTRRMFTFTDSAIERIKSVARGLSWPSVATRLSITPYGSTGLPEVVIDLRPNPLHGDRVIEVCGVRVFLEPAAEPYLQGVTVDYLPLGGVGSFAVKTADGTRPLKADGALGMG